MQVPKSKPPFRKPTAGFTLPAILVVVAALLILAVGILLVVGVERKTARSFVDRQRALLAARAGLEDVKGIFAQDAANDDYLILQGTLAPSTSSTKEPAPYLYLARGTGGGSSLKYRYQPLFSTATAPLPATGTSLKVPVVKDWIGTATKEVSTLPWYDATKLAWIPVLDEKGKMVSRYAYWVEDLQSRVDAGTAGNTKDATAHKRYGWTAGDTSKFKNGDTTALFPAPGLNAEDSAPASNGRDAKPTLDQVALYALALDRVYQRPVTARWLHFLKFRLTPLLQRKSLRHVRNFAMRVAGLGPPVKS